MQLGLSKKSFFQKLRHSRITGWLSPLPYLKNEAERCTVVQPHRIHVLAPGIELDRFMPKQEPKATLRQRLNLPREAFLMGILGRQDPLKGQDFALKALAKLPDDVHLVIMGAVSEDPIGAAYAQKLRTLKQELNLQKRVHFLPFDPDPSPFYQAIDLLLMTTQGETYGLVTVEALASKTPVLGNDSGGTPDLLDHGTFGYLYKPADKTDFCHKILHIKANPAEAMAKAALGFESVHQMLSKQAFLERFKNLVLR
jgi:glycosyltransferase involved in cell wall biosynthesis